MRFAKAAILWAPESFQKSLPNAAIYPLRFASGGFFLLQFVIDKLRERSELNCFRVSGISLNFRSGGGREHKYMKSKSLYFKPNRLRI